MKKVILTNHAPAPIGPYSQAISFNSVLYVSGQIAIEPSTGELVISDIESETHQVLKNLGAILKEAGIGYEQVLKCSVFVKDMNMFSRINVVYAQYFTGELPPARELVEVANLPRFVNIEISAIAALS
ncbi:MAG: RidA family protein [Saprospiraceae bacterium]|nr:RidA family protein [Saprospiraceae bacterium]